MYQGAFQEAPPQPAAFAEARWTEAGVLAPLLALMVVLGVSPAFFPAAVQATVQAVVSR
jgi:NADH:ubiquinone oxidoreductase subunit 4 (subunit M)